MERWDLFSSEAWEFVIRRNRHEVRARPGRHVENLLRSTACDQIRSGPYPVTWAVLGAHGLTASAEVEGRDRAPASIDQPRVTEGSWIRNGGVVVERTFAEALGVHTGDSIMLNGRPINVVGIAVTAAFSPYPEICLRWS